MLCRCISTCISRPFSLPHFSYWNKYSLPVLRILGQCAPLQMNRLWSFLFLSRFTCRTWRLFIPTCMEWRRCPIFGSTNWGKTEGKMHKCFFRSSRWCMVGYKSRCVNDRQLCCEIICMYVCICTHFCMCVCICLYIKKKKKITNQTKSEVFSVITMQVYLLFSIVSFSITVLDYIRFS